MILKNFPSFSNTKLFQRGTVPLVVVAVVLTRPEQNYDGRCWESIFRFKRTGKPKRVTAPGRHAPTKPLDRAVQRRDVARRPFFIAPFPQAIQNAALRRALAGRTASPNDGLDFERAARTFHRRRGALPRGQVPDARAAQWIGNCWESGRRKREVPSFERHHFLLYANGNKRIFFGKESLGRPPSPHVSIDIKIRYVDTIFANTFIYM